VASTSIARPSPPALPFLAGARPVAVGVCAALTGLAAALTVAQPLMAIGLFAAGGCVVLAFAAPVTHLTLLLVLTAVVGGDLQNRIGGPLMPSDALLLAGLLRAAVVVLGSRIEPRRLLVAGLMTVFMGAIVLQALHGLKAGADSSQVGAEGRELLDFGTLLIAMPIVADPAGRARLARGLVVVGLALGLWGLAVWGLGIQVGENVDVGLRSAQPFATSGAGQLHGGLYGYPVTTVMAATVLLSGGVRRGWARWSLLAVLATNATCLILTYERTFWMTTLVTLGFVVAKLDRGRRLRAVTAIVVAGVAALGVLATTSPADLIAIRDRALSLAKPSSDNSVRYRVVETRHVLARIKAKPVTGWGLGNTIHWGRPWQQVPPRSAWFAHNGYLWVIWKAGALAAALLFALVGWAVLLRAPPERDPLLRPLRIAAQGGLLVLLLSSITFPAFNAISITAVMGVLMAICFAPRSSTAARGSVAARRP
jgi:O-antigen ligase